MYLARELTGESLPAIGRQFGGRDHTTVLHACRRTGARIADDADARAAVEKLCRSLTPATVTHAAPARPRAPERLLAPMPQPHPPPHTAQRPLPAPYPHIHSPY